MTRKQFYNILAVYKWILYTSQNLMFGLVTALNWLLILILSHIFISIYLCMFSCVVIFCCVAGLISLNLLHLGGNLMSSLPRHLPPSIQQLYLSNNSLSGLDNDSFTGLLKLKYLRLSHCGLQSGGVHPWVFNLSSLVELDLSHNKLTTIPPVPSSLQYLYLEANEIQGEVHTQLQSPFTL